MLWDMNLLLSVLQFTRYRFLCQQIKRTENRELDELNLCKLNNGGRKARKIYKFASSIGLQVRGKTAIIFEN